MLSRVRCCSRCFVNAAAPSSPCVGLYLTLRLRGSVIAHHLRRVKVVLWSLILMQTSCAFFALVTDVLMSVRQNCREPFEAPAGSAAYVVAYVGSRFIPIFVPILAVVIAFFR